MNTISVDHYLAEGCGRCPLGGTPGCKVHAWQAELQALRRLVLACGLREEVKWGVPCYTFEGHNVLIVSAFKDHASLSFFKGALLEDPLGLLQKPGENSQAARVFRLRDTQALAGLEPILKAYVFEAIEIEKAGLRVDFPARQALDLPAELLRKFEEDPALQAAFESLTPGRQRGYVLHIAAAKQPKTREARIEKWAPRIFEGRGMQD